MSKFCVEVRVAVTGALIIKREPATSWDDALGLAQKMAGQMFPEDPMTTRLFRNGVYAYINVNDMGDNVMIRPYVVPEDDSVCAVPGECGLCEQRKN